MRNVGLMTLQKIAGYFALFYTVFYILGGGALIQKCIF